MNLMEKLISNKMMLTGADSGNESGKFSFLDSNGNIQSFMIPTIIAEAPVSKIEMKNFVKEEAKAENLLHVRVLSPSLSQANKHSYWYVGSYAKDKEKRMEPGIITNEYTHEKRAEKKYQNDLHLVTTLTGLAVAAVYSNLEGEVKVPYSGGLPIDEYKEIGEPKALQGIFGRHEIEFLDGPFEGKTIILSIESGIMNIEGISSSLSLNFDIKNGELVETEFSKLLGEHYALGDLGAGTTDTVLFTPDGVNKELTGTLRQIGTNLYIDQLMKKVKQLPEFQEIREAIDDPSLSPYQTREHFVGEVIEPEILRMIGDSTYYPIFKANWAYITDVNITNLVMETLEQYGREQMKELMTFWAKGINTKTFVLIGGGLLFGYPVFKEYKERFLFPPNLKESAFFTSKAYLIANYLEQMKPGADE